MADENINAQAAAIIAAANDAKYENKRANKKTSLDGDYSTDYESYPTSGAVNTALNTKVDKETGKGLSTNDFDDTYKNKLDGVDTGANKTVVDENIDADSENPVQNKAVKSALDLKQNAADAFSGNYNDLTNRPSIPTKTSDLTNDGDGTNAFLTEHQSLTALEVGFEKLDTPTSGYAASYKFTQGGNQVGPLLNLEKDKFLQSSEVVTVGDTPTSEETEAGLETGDVYLKWVVGTADNDGLTTNIIPVSSWADLQTADESTLTLANGVYSIKTSGVDTLQLKDGAVTSDKIAATVKNSWITQSDIDNSILAFANAYAAIVNPSS